MESFAFNGDEINGNGIATNVIVIGGVCEIAFTAYELTSTPMGGVCSISATCYGDVARVSPIGLSPMSISMALGNQIAKFRMVWLEPTTVVMGFDLSANVTRYAWEPMSANPVAIDVSGNGSSLSRVSPLVPSSIGIALTGTGEAARTVLLSGICTMAIAASQIALSRVMQLMPNPVVLSIGTTGELTRYKVVPLPPGLFSIDIGSAAAISGTFRLSGTVEIAVDVSSPLIANTVYAQLDSIALAMSCIGKIFNNPAGSDLPENIMIRPASEREMVR